MHDSPPADADPVRRYQGELFRSDHTIRSGIPSYLSHAAELRGNAPYLTAVAEDGGTTTLTYRELDEYSRRTAHWLRTECAVPPGAAVGLLPVNDAESVIGLFALLRAGNPALILNPADPTARLTEQTGALDIDIVLRGPRVPEDGLPGSIRLPDPRKLPAPPPGSVETPADPACDALYFGTSGSTAASKLVAQTHANAVANAEAVRRHHGLGSGDRILGCLPIHHVNGVHFTLIATLVAGAHAVLAERFSPFGYPALLTTYRPRVASVVPSLLDALTETWRHRELPGNFGYFVSAAAPLSRTTARAVHDRIGARVIQGYGLTETTNFSVTMPTDLSDEAYRHLVLDADIPSVGIAVHGNEVAVLTADGSLAEPGATGEICMRGHNVMSRYANNEASTAKAFRGGWFHSQDLGHQTVDDESGRTVFVLTGRTKNVAKVRGETVSLEEMERVLRAHPGLRDAACAAVPQPLLGEVVSAAVVAPPELTDSELRAHLRRHFAEGVLPTRIVRVDTVPRTATGKILRPALQDLLSPPAP
ncbi:class I adenylate-forming enzyme family protein [Streptomyces sp. NPDC056323]|uniref:class I adenylate-forming enzyme family protein n=1 Tax=unclassified Streptomyces TaxID=2593676 RepID=UPI0035DE7342